MCNNEVTRGTIIFDKNGTSTVYCRLHIPRAHLIGSVDKCKNIWEGFVCQHMLDENHKPITVNSLKELREAEKRTNSVLAIMADDDISKPPAHEPDAGNIARKYRKKFNRDPAAYTSPSASAGVSAGPVSSAKETLVDHPNPV